MGVPPNHPFWIGIFHEQNQQFLGTSIYGNIPKYRTGHSGQPGGSILEPEDIPWWTRHGEYHRLDDGYIDLQDTPYNRWGKRTWFQG